MKPTPKFYILTAAITAGLSLLMAAPAQAAACCGSGGVAPQIVMGDYRAQIQVAQSWSGTYADANPTGTTRMRPSSGQTQQWISNFSAAWAIPKLLDDRLQINGALPLAVSSEGPRLGDLRAGLGVEVVRNWVYSAWRPDVFGFVQLQMPTGSSIYDSQLTVGGTSQLAGTGFWRPALGFLATKIWGDWDASLMPEFHYSIARSFLDSDGDTLSVAPGFGGAVVTSIGWSPGSGTFRVGARLGWSAAQAREVLRNQRSTATAPSQVLELGADVAWLISPLWSLTANYTDQGALPLSTNTTLSRTIAIQIQKRFFR